MEHFLFESTSVPMFMWICFQHCTILDSSETEFTLTNAYVAYLIRIQQNQGN